MFYKVLKNVNLQIFSLPMGEFTMINNRNEEAVIMTAFLFYKFVVIVRQYTAQPVDYGLGENGEGGGSMGTVSGLGELSNNQSF